MYPIISFPSPVPQPLTLPRQPSILPLQFPVPNHVDDDSQHYSCNSAKDDGYDNRCG